MSRLVIDYDSYGAERLYSNLRSGAIAGAFDSLVASVNRIIEYLSRFITDFEYANSRLRDKINALHYKADQTMKEGEDPKELQATAYALSDVLNKNEFYLSNARGELRKAEELKEGLERAAYWSKELEGRAMSCVATLSAAMEDYISADSPEVDIFHSEVSRLRKLTDGSV